MPPDPATAPAPAGRPDASPSGDPTALTCPSCAASVEPADRFCEDCGHALEPVAPLVAGTAPPAAPDDPDRTAAPEPGIPATAGEADTGGPVTGLSSWSGVAAAVPDACTSCGVGTVGADGFCDECGRRAPAPNDHVEAALDPSPEGPVAAGVSDRGHRRKRNEDSFGLGRAVAPDGLDVVVAVVADGVASVPDGDVASRTACDAAVAAGRHSVAAGDELETVAAIAADAARRAVAAVAPPDGSPPACTYVAAVVGGGTAVVTWVGDSRAYWLTTHPAGESWVISEDDSWASEMVAAGLVDPADAWSDPRAHVITRWLAADAPDLAPRSVVCTVDGSGVLLLCSDGIWNHLPDPDVLAGILAPGSDVATGARALVEAALDDGGYDNATAALVAVDAPHGGAR